MAMPFHRILFHLARRVKDCTRFVTSHMGSRNDAGLPGVPRGTSEPDDIITHMEIFNRMSLTWGTVKTEINLRPTPGFDSTTKITS